MFIKPLRFSISTNNFQFQQLQRQTLKSFKHPLHQHLSRPLPTQLLPDIKIVNTAADISMRDRDAEFARKRDTLAKADKRIAELDRIISRLYEDNVMGKLSDDRFIKMSHDYELEQSNLKSMAEVLRKELKQQEQQKTNAKAFVAAVKKYTDMQELDAAVLREFIDRIEVSHADKKSKTREITIVYNFIGAFDFTRAIEEANNTTQKQQKTA